MRQDTKTTCHCGAAYAGSDHCPACGCEQYETINVRDCGHTERGPVYTVGKKRPHTGMVCHGDRYVGRVTSQLRQRGERYWTATPLMPDGTYAPTASLGTRFPSFMAAARALWWFDREYCAPNTAPGLPSERRAVLSAACMDFRNRFGVVPGRKASQLADFA